MMSIRKPAVANQFYPGNIQALRRQIETCFTDPRGPGSITKKRTENKPIKGYIVPHAGYVYSGPIAAHAYAHLIRNGFADTFIILGPNHTSMGSGVSLMTTGSWQTPLGSVPINSAVAEQIHRGIIDKDESAHLYEHSIEVQLPFLQFIADTKPFDFVPLCMAMQDHETAYEVGTLLADVIRSTSQKIVLIASSDFSHAGFDYQSTPPSGLRVDTYAEQQDKLALDKIQTLDAEGLINTVYQHTITMCGYGPVAAVMIAAKQMGATRSELLKYGTSYEVHAGNSCVGYGAFALY